MTKRSIIKTASKTKAKPNASRKSTSKPNASLLQHSSARQFTCALDDPFCTESFGAKVPDEFVLPSEALTLRHRYTVSSANTGDYIVVTPHPLVGSIVVPGTTGGPPIVGALSGTSTTVQVNSVVGNVANIISPRPTTAGTMISVASAGRVVGWGVRVKNITAAANVAGDLVVAVLPTTGCIPNNLIPLVETNSTTLTSNPGNQWDELARYASLPTTSYSAVNGNYSMPVITGLENVPSSDVISNAEIAQTGGILIKPKLHSPGAAWRFRPLSTTVGNSTVATGDAVVAISPTQGGAGTGLHSYVRDALDTTGHNCVVLSLSGNSASQTYEVEVIYHVEGIPIINISGGTQAAINPTAFTASPMLPRPKLDSLVHSVLQSPWMEFVKHEGSRLMGSMTSALPGLMTKAAMMALA